jgi:radical SAM protein with 4Fe4S-binding SPASM domain
MAKASFNIAVDRLALLIESRYRHGKEASVTVQYVGGEVLYLTYDYIEFCVNLVREKISPLFGTFRDGLQTNLTTSLASIKRVNALFERRIGTSIDSFTTQRKLSGSSTKYKKIFSKRHEDTARNNVRFPAVTLINSLSAPTLIDEMVLADTHNYGLTLTHEFRGGKESSTGLPPAELAVVYGELFDEWAMKMSVPVEPFNRLMIGRLGLNENIDGCAFDRDCANNSLNLEPNGDLYVCQEMADMKLNKMGNVFSDTFSDVIWGRMSRRVNLIHKDCVVCPFYTTCRGGCMAEALGDGLGEYGKPSACLSWKLIFSKMDHVIDEHGRGPVKAWLNSLKRIDSAATSL